MIWSLIPLAMSTYILVVVFTFWNYWLALSCVKELSIFIIGMCYIYGFQVLRKLLLIYIWKKNKDPGIVQAKIDFWFIIFVVIPELALYIYGNCIIYKPATEQCKETKPYNSLWNCSLVVIIYGYFYMLLALCFILFYCAVFLLYRAWSNDAATREEDVMANLLSQVPMLDNFQQQRRDATRIRESLLYSS